MQLARPVVIAAVTMTQAAAAQSVLYSTSFEEPRFSVGAVDGQDGWVSSSPTKPDITAAIAERGDQSLRFAQTGGVATTEKRIDYGSLSDGFDSDPIVQMQFDIRLDGPPTGQTGTLFLNLSSQAVAGGNDTTEGIGGLAFVGPNGAAAPGPQGTVQLAFGEWTEVVIEADLENRTSSLFVDRGDPQAIEWADPLAGDQYFGGFFFTAVNSGNFNGRFVIDSLRITAIPSPGSAVALTALLLPFVRRRRSGLA